MVESSPLVPIKATDVSDMETKTHASQTYQRKVTISTSAPSGGQDGDIWIQY